MKDKAYPFNSPGRWIMFRELGLNVDFVRLKREKNMKRKRTLCHASVLVAFVLVLAITYVCPSVTAAEEDYIQLPMPQEFIPALQADGSPLYVTADAIETEFRQFSPDLKNFYHNKKISRFIVPQGGWIKDMLRTYDMLLSDVGIRAKADTWDCENFSGLLNALTTLRIWRAGYLDTRAALGWLRVNAKESWAGMPGTMHALIFTNTVKGIYIVEPQNGKYVSLAEYPNRQYIEEVYLF